MGFVQMISEALSRPNLFVAYFAAIRIWSSLNVRTQNSFGIQHVRCADLNIVCITLPPTSAAVSVPSNMIRNIVATVLDTVYKYILLAVWR